MLTPLPFYSFLPKEKDCEIENGWCFSCEEFDKVRRIFPSPIKELNLFLNFSFVKSKSLD